jgi:hypothetical protein
MAGEVLRSGDGSTETERYCHSPQPIDGILARTRRYRGSVGARSDLPGRFSASPFSRTCPNGGTGRRAHLASVRRQRRAGSNPASGTPSRRHLTRRTRPPSIQSLARCARQLRLAAKPAAPTGPRVLCLGRITPGLGAGRLAGAVPGLRFRGRIRVQRRSVQATRCSAS